MVFHITSSTLSSLALAILVLQNDIQPTLQLDVKPPAAASAESSLLILGLGRVGLDCARLALKDHNFQTVYGTVRSMPPPPSHPASEQIDASATQQQLQQPTSEDGITRIPFDATTVTSILPQCSHILFTLQRPDDPTGPYEQIVDCIIDNLQSHPTNVRWIGLISTTGVYGNHDGAWVHEDSELLIQPQSSASKYVDYEQFWETQIRQIEATRRNDDCPRLRIFRSSGIYDANRSALHTVYKQGIDKESTQAEESPNVTNRIHSLDIARAVLHSTNRNLKPISRVYNLADDLPETRSVVLRYATTLLEQRGVVVKEKEPPSGKGDAVQSNRDRRRVRERKLVSNKRMMDELFPDEHLLYPTYKEGLLAILDGSGTPWRGEMHPTKQHQ